MSEPTSFNFDHQRHRAGLDLSPAHQSEFQRLVKTLCYGPKSQFLILEFNDVGYRTGVVTRIDELLRTEHHQVTHLDLTMAEYSDFAAVEAALIGAANGHEAVHIFGGESWFDRPRFEAFNIRREAVGRGAAARLLLWLTTDRVEHLAQWAPDLWSWRGGVYDFTRSAIATTASPMIDREGPGAVDTRSLAERAERISEIREFLLGNPGPDDDMKLPLLDELAGLYASIGELDEALRIRQEEQLPVYERLGDVRERAITLGKMADIFQARGELDEALRIRQEEQLPVYERLGDVRSRAITPAKIGFQLVAANRHREAASALSRAPADTRGMGLPEAEIIAEFMRSNGLASDDRGAVAPRAEWTPTQH